MSSRFTNLVSQHTCLTIICVNNEQKSPIQLNYTYSLTQFREITLTRIKSSAFFENKHTRILLKSVNIKYTKNSKECVAMHIKPCIYKITRQIMKKNRCYKN